jgi:hypothetical protein
MQTFFPDRDPHKCASVLDIKRLYKQIVECKQIFNTLQKLQEDPTQKIGWRNHPAVKMWQGYENYLRFYQSCMLEEWCRRRWDFEADIYQDNLASGHFIESQDIPPWVGNEEFHASHRSNLLRKDESHYRQFGWTESTDIEYFWPSKEGY